MTVAGFIGDPWKDDRTHSAYSGSFLHMRPAPEYATGEVVVASCYRNFVFPGLISEGKVPQYGRDLDKRLRKASAKPANAGHLRASDLSAVIDGPLRSPKQPNQTAKRFLQITPVVPDAAIYSLSARLTHNSWNPGLLIMRMIGYGSTSSEQFARQASELRDALSIDSSDELWARFFQSELAEWRPREVHLDDASAGTLPEEVPAVRNWRQSPSSIPASQFVADLHRIIELKPQLTRRQWITFVESLLRLAAASHLFWVCQMNQRVLALAWDVLDSESAPRADLIHAELSKTASIWRYNQGAARTIRHFAREFVIGRAGINLLLWHCDEVGIPTDHSLDNNATIAQLLCNLHRSRDRFPRETFRRNLEEVLDADPRVTACKRGISSNVAEFLRHVLGQRQTTEAGLDSYDQGYYLRKRGEYASAPWHVSFGPVATIMMVHCSVAGALGAQTVADFCAHLERYGFDITSQDVVSSELGASLRSLGLVLDSPDAEGGMVLVSPFVGAPAS